MAIVTLKCCQTVSKCWKQTLIECSGKYQCHVDGATGVQPYTNRTLKCTPQRKDDKEI